MRVIEIVSCEITPLSVRLARPTGGSGLTSIHVLFAALSSKCGRRGWGFSYILRGPIEPSLWAARSLANEVAGVTLHHPEALWRQLANGFNRTGGGPNLIALAAIDVAAWDLWSRALDLPLSAALGGAPRACRVYASSGFQPGEPPQRAAETALAAVHEGFAGVKPRLAGQPADRRLLECVRAAIGDDVLLMADANEKFDLVTARYVLEATRSLGLCFLEEPLAADDVDGLRQLARTSPASLAAGEHLQTLHAAKTLVDTRAISIIQPDLAMMGGLTPCLHACRYAEARGVAVAPHFLPGLFVHLAAAQANVLFLEHFPLIEPVIAGWPGIEAGVMRPGTAPGHGLMPAPGAIEEFAIG